MSCDDRNEKEQEKNLWHHSLHKYPQLVHLYAWGVLPFAGDDTEPRMEEV